MQLYIKNIFREQARGHLIMFSLLFKFISIRKIEQLMKSGQNCNKKTAGQQARLLMIELCSLCFRLLTNVQIHDLFLCIIVIS